ncbi:hypothetical protein PDIDSM_1667 [Penicillium digitatum]|nr:hypothetical protein PDIDSM_1667 [Penicillium digitatum]
MAAADVAPQFGAELKVSNGISWVDEIHQFYRERSAIEKEYASKLTALCKSILTQVEEDQPLECRRYTHVNPRFPRSASLTTWTTQLNAVESHRRAGQNLYLISINVTNKLKEKFYHEYVPEVIDGLQNLNETRVAKMNLMWLLAAQLEKASLSNSTEHITNLFVEIPRNNPRLDSLMFLQHNVTQSQEPANLAFEPSPVWHDDDSIIIDEAAKVFLRNVLSKSKTQIRELRVESDQKRREVEASKKVRENVQDGKDNRNELDVVRSIFYIQESLHEVDRKWVTAEVETATIMAVAGDLSLGAQNHNFRSQTFKIPTNCDLCGERIWGLSAKGFDCRDCGYTCHSKCQMKVPAECPGEQTKEDKKKLKALRQDQAGAMPVVDVGTPTASTAAPSLRRQNTMNSLSSGYAASSARSISNVPTQNTPESPADDPPAPVAQTKPAAAKENRVLAPPPTAYMTAPPPSDSGMGSKSKEPWGKMLYAYQATGSDEVSVEDGDEVVILQPDDGSGWMRVRSGANEGLVPAAYVEAVPTPSPVPSASPSVPERPGSTYSNSSASLAGSAAQKRVGPAVAPRRGAKKLQYVEALYEYEARSDMEWNMAEGDRFVLINRDSGDGWADVERGGVTKSVPANYIQEV